MTGTFDTSGPVIATYTFFNGSTTAVTLGTPTGVNAQSGETAVKVTSGKFVPFWTVSGTAWTLGGVAQSWGPWSVSNEMGPVNSQPGASAAVNYKTEVLVTPGDTPCV